MTSYIHFRCPCCHGSQYRTSAFDVSEKSVRREMHFLQIVDDYARPPGRSAFGSKSHY